MNKKVVTFGEIMMRLSPPGFQRFCQARNYNATFGGGEANVAVSLANFGVRVDYISRLPNNDLGDACVGYLRQFGVGVDWVNRGGERLGLYFIEKGSVQRGSKIVYDRAYSSMSTIEPGMLDWRAIFSDADWFHLTGITPALSRGAAAVCLEAVQTAKDMGLTISCDLNYRTKLWKWGKRANDVMPEIVELCDVAIGNEEDAEKVFGISAPDTDVVAAEVAADKYQFVCEELNRRFPKLNIIAITLRGSISASHNTWSGVLWNQGNFYTGPSFDIPHIVDRVGGGDSFAAGLIYGLRKYGQQYSKVLEFAVAASCLKHSIDGDFNLVTVAEVERIMCGDISGRVSR